MSTTDVLPDEATPFGQRVRERLRNERIIWLTTVGRDGTPQPNPLWFVWSGDDTIVIYTPPDAHRLTHIAARPTVSLHFNGTPSGGDIVVIRGTAERADDLPSPDDHPEYLAKYDDDMVTVVGSVAQFAATYHVPIRIRLTGTRGF
ncbi:TIGR03667 family PPOX class F420-dependent oxidoreductase [Phytoactinopolyspora limicola]|uniref:TIGR03667 family PPOX class F420-dependent oxidoreductase n=1 Tax=Phytoactinopolyspora limicola TaxID=2715536 RepID=UPI00140D66AF|nr:TIGR03667 family PPOX class F420-dependent oxidoreductase [Phytoactinopolyspora limicola]